MAMCHEMPGHQITHRRLWTNRRARRRKKEDVFVGGGRTNDHYKREKVTSPRDVIGGLTGFFA